MKAKTVMPCICAGNPDFIADGTAGMPVLRPYGGHDRFWHIWCPNCKRGIPSFDYTSPYKALQAWNEMQEHLRKFDCGRCPTMADILIRGMEMPKTCVQCDLKIYDPEMRWDENGIEQIGAWVCKRTREIIWNTQRGENCPLVPLPEGHGRLGDLDALDRAFTSLRFNADGHLAHWDDRRNWCLHGYEIERLIGEAPTIVPAEGVKE